MSIGILSANPEVCPLMVIADQIFRKDISGMDEPYENNHVMVKIWVLLEPDKEEGQTEKVCPSSLHPHLSVLNIVFDRIQNFLCIGDSQNL